MKTDFITEHTGNTEDGDGRRAQKKEILGPVGSMSNYANPPHLWGMCSTRGCSGCTASPGDGATLAEIL